MNLAPDFVDAITRMAAEAQPSPQQLHALLQGWQDYFAAMNIPTEKQKVEFLAIITARVTTSGSISLVAPSTETFE